MKATVPTLLMALTDGRANYSHRPTYTVLLLTCVVCIGPADATQKPIICRAYTPILLCASQAVATLRFNA